MLPLNITSLSGRYQICRFVRIKKTRILVRSTRSEALRTIQLLIPVGSENIRLVRKFQNFMQNQTLQNPKDALKITWTHK